MVYKRMLGYAWLWKLFIGKGKQIDLGERTDELRYYR